MILILVKSDDIRSVKAKACHGLHGSQWVNEELQNSKTKAAMYILVVTSDIEFV